MNYVFPKIKDMWTEKLLFVAFNLATPGREELPGPSRLWHQCWKALLFMSTIYSAKNQSKVPHITWCEKFRRRITDSLFHISKPRLSRLPECSSIVTAQYQTETKTDTDSEWTQWYHVSVFTLTEFCADNLNTWFRSLSQYGSRCQGQGEWVLYNAVFIQHD